MSNSQEVNSPGKHDHENTLVQLKEAQSKSGYISEESIAEIAESLEISVSEVYGVATFYSFLSIKPRGRNVIKICQSVLCHLKNSRMIMDCIEKELGIRPGETTADGKFSFELTNCIGACDDPPAMLINEDVHANLTPEKIAQILKSYK
ncbi:NADH-quinone oxidoreductase subunit NuoE [Chloroflexota bacterium]